MGGSAIGVSLRALGKGKRSAPRVEVYDATRALLVKTWRAKLPKKYRDAAVEWVDNGLDSLLTVGLYDNERDTQDLTQPAEEVAFWFYDSVEWPLALAEHWLRLAMIEVRKDWEKELAKLGYAIKGKYLEKSDERFILAGPRIGHPDSDGVFWQLPEYDFTDYEELDAKTTKLVQAAKKKCACPWCAKK
jgi:hypothetical protein